MCFDKEAEVQDKGRDRYGRTLGRVYCVGVDANAEQVRRGMAWVYDKYVTDHSLYSYKMRRGRRGADCGPTPIQCRLGSGARATECDIWENLKLVKTPTFRSE